MDGWSQGEGRIDRVNIIVGVQLSDLWTLELEPLNMVVSSGSSTGETTSPAVEPTGSAAESTNEPTTVKSDTGVTSSVGEYSSPEAGSSVWVIGVIIGGAVILFLTGGLIVFLSY